jgi:taurine--2-oxoglutarate transaminase
MSTPNQILQDNLHHTIFSWSKQSGLNPLSIERAKGVYLYDRSGKRFLDFNSQLMNVNIGHGHPKVTEAVMRQMNQVSYVSPAMITEARGKLGKKLAEITPGNLSRTFFTNGGADAIENAYKLARNITGRHKIISLYQSYHGATYGAASAGGDPRGLSHDSQGFPISYMWKILISTAVRGKARRRKNALKMQPHIWKGSSSLKDHNMLRLFCWKGKVVHRVV